MKYYIIVDYNVPINVHRDAAVRNRNTKCGNMRIPRVYARKNETCHYRDLQ